MSVEHTSAKKVLLLNRLIALFLPLTMMLAVVMAIIAVSNAISHWWDGDRVTAASAFTFLVSLLAFLNLIWLRRRIASHGLK